MRLNASTGSWLQDSAGCLRASLGDGQMVILPLTICKVVSALER